ncbi:BPI fold-containing family B member 3-like isoform X2 [Harpia harpyja]|uniref:BPI fold-containing family B member 3-like isoform X2 n=1 Tax=Harpia harpyja TaxID=202280 RepID=UPI0022B1CB51|nr:BPI fold-containing family B member 3-like isoform X2 [Harpia harpyja]
MSAFWAVFLLCSLLTPSQGLAIMSSVGKVDVDDIKHSLAKRDLQKLQGGLLGGKLLSSLLEKDSPLGSVLGEDGAVGSLLSGDGVLGGLLERDGVLGGLLGGEGVLGGLLGRDGVTGKILGGDGVLGGLLDRDGVLGGLLDRDGVLGGLLGRDGVTGKILGGDGVLGGLLDRDGVLGGLLGRDGVLGGLLDRDGVLGGLLGRDGVTGKILGGDGVAGRLLGGDGVLGGLLGRDGLVDGLLGKDGLVDGLLDVVLDILIGKGGVLGKDGLVGNLLGGNGGDLTGLKIVNNTLPKISLRSLPGFGHEVGFNTQLLVESTSALGRALCVQVEADVVMLVQDKWAALQSNKDCKTLDINIRVRPKVPLLDQPLKRLLSDVLREVGCNIVNSRLNVVSALLGSRTPAFPLGTLGDLPPFSIISGDAIQLDLNLLVGDAEGGVVASTQGPPLAATLLLATGHPPLLRLSQRTLSTLLEPIQGQGAFSLSITDSMVPDSISLSTSALLPLMPQVAKVLPGSLPLELHVRVANKPVVAVRDRRATATLKASIDVFSPLLQSSQKPLFSLDTDIVLNIIPSVSNGKLQTSLALDSINLTRAPLRLDPLSVSPLAGWLKQVLAAAYVPAINDALRVSVPLPNILNTSLRNAKVDITDADDSFNQNSLKRSCSGGPLTLFAV